MQAESKVIQGCYYCKKCENCKKFFEIENECNAEGLSTFNKEIVKKDFKLVGCL